MHLDMLIGGHKIGGACNQSIGKTQHYAPYDKKLVGTAAEGGKSEVQMALESASDAFASWKQSTVLDRQTFLRKIASLVREEAAELSQLLAVEVGKPIKMAEAEVARLHKTFDLAADILTHDAGRLIPVSYDERGKHCRCLVERFPIGVIFGIVPYNWPFNLGAHKIAPAIATGNTIVIKTPSIGTLSTLALGDLIHRAGCPDGVVNVLNIPAQLAQDALLDDRVKMLSFTGSPKVGWMLKELLPRKRVSLELGSDSTSVVLSDADIDRAVTKLIPSSFGYAGQVCISTQHILVEEPIYSEFKDKFVQAAKACKFGDPMNDNVVCGPLSKDEDAERVLSWIEEAESQGAKILCGGSRMGRVIVPIVMEDVPRSSRLGSEEVFGPVVTIRSVANRKDAIDWVNRSQFGIHASVFTHRMDWAEELYQQLVVGGLVVNDSPSLRFDAMPYGGEKNSGFGREGILNAMEEMTTEKVLLTRLD